MAVLDLIKKVKVQTLSFEKHPCRDLDMETKVHYLNALALIANEDGAIDEKEEEYLTILINSFDLSEDTLSECIEFAKNPDESQLVEMMDAFGTKDLKYNLILDAMLIAQRDGTFSDTEKALIEQYFEMFKISEKEAEDLKYIFEMFHAQDGNRLYRYFTRIAYIKKELFEYLFKYYKIDFEYELKEDERKTLIFDFFIPEFETGGLYNGSELTTKHINNAQFIIFLNHLYLEKKIVIDDDNIVIINNSNRTKLMALTDNYIFFDDKNNDFTVIYNKWDNAVHNISIASAIMYVEWINKFLNTNYSLVQLWGTAYWSNSRRKWTNFGQVKIHKGIEKNEFALFSAVYDTDDSKYMEINNRKILINNSSFMHLDDLSVANDFISKDTSFRMMKLLKEEN